MDTPYGEDNESRRERAKRFEMAHTIREPEIPAGGHHIWGWFWRLSNMRGASDAGPCPLTVDATEAFARVTGERIAREEIDVLLDMDIEYRNAIAELRQEAEEEAEAGRRE